MRSEQVLDGRRARRAKVVVMTPDFDAELYLRLVGERALLDQRKAGGRAPWDGPTIEVASALVAIGALDDDAAQGIVDDYAVAAGLRNGGHGMHRMHGHTQPPGKRLPLKAPRVIATGWTFEPEWGTVRVHYVSLGDRNTSLAISAHEKSPGSLMGAQGPNGAPISQPLVTDDQGTTEVANFSGGGGSGGYNGKLETARPLSESTKWIDFGEGRIELEDVPNTATCLVEVLPPMGPAARHLRRRLETSRHRHHFGLTSIDLTIETFIAAGALEPDDPLIEEAHQVSSAFSGNPGRAGTLSPQWASLLAGRQRADGPTGAVAIGLVTDPVDGSVICAEGLVSTPESFRLDISISPGAQGGPGPFNVAVRDASLAWSGEDDLDNRYAGSQTSWGGGPDLGEGTIEFWPPIDRQANELRLMATGLEEQAVFTIPLPDWDSPS
jgi:hypothetical protein